MISYHLNTKKKGFINMPMILRIVGLLLSIEAIFMIIPFIAALIFHETDTYIPYIISICLTGGIGVAMTFLRSNARDVGKREAILLTGLTWIVLAIFGMLPFLLCGTHMSVTDAFFETISGFTTTGASVLDSLNNIPKSILLWRCVQQWFGGLGIILFTLALVPMLNNAGGMQLFNAEVTGITHDKLRPRVSNTAKWLWGLYICLTLLLILLLVVSDMELFDAICYGLTTMSTGGFSTTDAGVNIFNSHYIKAVFTIFMIIGGVNFNLLYMAILGKGSVLYKNEIFRWYMAIILGGALIFAISMAIKGEIHSIADATIIPMFQSAAIISTTSIAEPGFNEWGAPAMLILIIMVFMGGCAGSTSGGAKVDRFVVLLKFLKNEFYKMMHPGTVTTVCINGKGTQTQVVQKTLAFLFIYGLVIMAGGMILAMLGLPLNEAFFRSLSAIGNSAMSVDLTDIPSTYSNVPALGKWVLSLIMLIGRLEIFTVLLLFTPLFWKR